MNVVPVRSFPISASFIRALLVVGVDANDQNLLQNGRPFIMRLSDGPLVVDLKDIVIPDLGVRSRGQTNNAYEGGMRAPRDKARQILSVAPRRLHSPIWWK